MIDYLLSDGEKSAKPWTAINICAIDSGNNPVRNYYLRAGAIEVELDSILNIC